MKIPLIAAPGSGAVITLFTVTGRQATEARRIILSINSSADSAASGVSFQYLPDGGTTYRVYTSYTYATATGVFIYRVAPPLGANGLKVIYTNSASVLTTWEGTIAIIYDEIASP